MKCRIFAAADDEFVMCVNGEEILRGHHHAELAVKDVALAKGDVITVRATDHGGERGFCCVIVSEKKDQVLATGLAWGSYQPQSDADWADARLIKAVSPRRSGGQLLVQAGFQGVRHQGRRHLGTGERLAPGVSHSPSRRGLTGSDAWGEVPLMQSGVRRQLSLHLRIRVGDVPTAHRSLAGRSCRPLTSTPLSPRRVRGGFAPTRHGCPKLGGFFVDSGFRVVYNRDSGVHVRNRPGNSGSRGGAGRMNRSILPTRRDGPHSGRGTS